NLDYHAEDGIRDRNVTGVQTCALPIFSDGAAQLRVGNAHDLKLWARWGKDGTQRVEDRGYLQRAANGHDVRDRWVVRGCVEKGKAGFLELAHSTVNVQIQWDVESF